jgi:pathogenesis-related protein 1
MEYAAKQLVLLLALASAVIVVTAQTQAEQMVDAHNAVRADVGVGPVSWDDTVAAYAEAYAEKRRADCQLLLSPEGGPYGENILRGNGTEWYPVDAVNAWASEKEYYDHATNTCSAPPGESCASYTQVVWSDTIAIGCAGVICDGDANTFIICSYSPPGNVEGQAPY